MNDVSQRLSEVMKEQHISYRRLAELTGMTKSSVANYAAGNRSIPLDKLKLMAKALHINASWLVGWSEQKEAIGSESPFPSNIISLSEMQRKRVPILGNIACGEPIFADEEHELHIDVDISEDVDFCLRAQGDSMIGARIYDGDLVFIRKQDTVENGEIAAVLIGDEATLKRVQYDRENNTISLFAENPAYPTLRYSGAELDQIRVLGKAIIFQATVR